MNKNHIYPHEMPEIQYLNNQINVQNQLKSINITFKGRRLKQK